MQWIETSRGWQSSTTYANRAMAAKAAQKAEKTLNIPVTTLQLPQGEHGEKARYALFTVYRPDSRS